MRQKVLTGFAFALLIATGAVTAGIVAKKAPSSVQQTVSTATTTTTVTSTTTTPTTTTTPARKVTICHHTQGKKGTKHVTVKVTQSAVKAHMKHGDSLGACNTPKAKKFHSRPAHVK